MDDIYFQGYPPVPPHAQQQFTPLWSKVPGSFIPPQSRLCQTAFDSESLDRLNPGCLDGDCIRVHNLEDLQPPAGYQLLAAGVLQDVVRMYDWGSKHADNPVLVIPTNQLYPTKFTRWLQENNQVQPEAQIPRLCYKFLFAGKCPYWHNCLFMHVDTATARAALSLHRCQIVGAPAGCYPCCPYQHGAHFHGDIADEDEFPSL